MTNLPCSRPASSVMVAVGCCRRCCDYASSCLSTFPSPSLSLLSLSVSVCVSVGYRTRRSGNSVNLRRLLRNTTSDKSLGLPSSYQTILVFFVFRKYKGVCYGVSRIQGATASRLTTVPSALCHLINYKARSCPKW